MNQKESNPENILELADEIQKFIENKREPDQLITAHVKEISQSDNIITFLQEENFNFYTGAFVVVNGTSGVVQDKYSNIIKILFKERLEFQVGDIVEIDSSLMNLIVDRLAKTIDRIKENNLDDNNLKILQFILGNGKPQYNLYNVDFNAANLSIPQKDAISRTLGADCFHLIIGPPGTGKTYVIKEIINQLLSKDKKILVTASTNNAVDNILEKFKDSSPKTILRIGSSKEINPHCHKFTLEKRREQSDDWEEVKQLDRLITKQKELIQSLFIEKRDVKNQIIELKSKKENYNDIISSTSETKKLFRTKSLKYKPSNSQLNNEIINLERELSKLNFESKEYENLAINLLNLGELAETLPKQEDFYKLEDEIKKAKSQKIIRRITSPFRRKGYQKYQENLQTNEAEYNEMNILYENYGVERSLIEENYVKLYGNSIGNPYNDSLKKEIELTNLNDKYIPIKIDSIRNGLYSHYGIIYKSYQLYISSLNDEVNGLKNEMKLVDVDINLKTVEYDNISKEIKGLVELVEINKNSKNLVLEYIDNEILNNSHLIVATVISAAHPLLKDESFDWVVMDEASQVASYMSLIPLLKTTRFVLVGDNQQLQPIEESKLSDNLNLSIFNRLLDNFPDSSTFLDTQYRMNERISNIASELFYDNNLKTFPTIKKQTLNSNFNKDTIELLNPNVPVTYLDTCDLKYYEDGVGSGCENRYEAKLVVKIVNMLLESVDACEIGVISPYKRHKIYLQNQLDGISKAVEVDTVYSFQGREKDVIIISFCNSKLGRLNKFIKKFIERPSQLNVAMTRARKKLILVGNSKNLKESKLLFNVIQLIGEENTVKCSDEILK